jgi:nucleotide-binding universal stress UspA family protein
MPIQRIVIAIDASPTSIEALEATADLAARWRAEVLGIYVEDTDLLKAATLPFAGEVGSHSGSFRAINPKDIQRQFRTLADRARREFDRVVQRFSTASSFKVARGAVKEELLTALHDADLLILGKGGRSLAAHLGLGSTARAIATAARGTVLMHSHLRRISGPVAVVYDGSGEGEGALSAAIELTRICGPDLIALCIAETREASQELASTASDTVAAAGLTAHCRHLLPADASRLVRLSRFYGADAMIVPARSEVLPDTAVEAVITGFSGPVFVAGGTDDGARPTA